MFMEESQDMYQFMLDRTYYRARLMNIYIHICDQLFFFFLSFLEFFPQKIQILLWVETKLRWKLELLAMSTSWPKLSQI